MRLISSPSARAGRARRPATRDAVPYSDRETVGLLLAALVAASGLIHVGAGVDHFAELPAYTVAFAVVAAAQFAWAGLLMRKPTRIVLIWGAWLTASVIVVWILSRTVGSPLGSPPWRPEAVGVADLVETADELVTLIAALALAASPGRAFARQLVKRMAPVIVAMLLFTVLYGLGAHAG
jgi:hypothetical protein